MQKVHTILVCGYNNIVETVAVQQVLFQDIAAGLVKPMREQLLKWVGNKQRFAHEIAAFFPKQFRTYIEPFLGSGAVLGTLAPPRAIASDSFGPLIEIWQTLRADPEIVKSWYKCRYELVVKCGKLEAYERVMASYNANPNGADLLFISRTCYGGVMRFRMADGHCSTPCGIHAPMPPERFCRRVDLWSERTRGAHFLRADYREVMEDAKPGDLIYCDPPYSHSQTILYGAQQFSLTSLLEEIERCRSRGVAVALSIDGTKKSGGHVCSLPLPPKLFVREVFLSCGRSMLRRFQCPGESLDGEVVHDRLLLTY